MIQTTEPRPLKRAIQRYVEDELAEVILNNVNKFGGIIKLLYNSGDEKLTITIEDNNLEKEIKI